LLRKRRARTLPSQPRKKRKKASHRRATAPAASRGKRKVHYSGAHRSDHSSIEHRAKKRKVVAHDGRHDPGEWIPELSCTDVPAPKRPLMTRRPMLEGTSTDLGEGYNKEGRRGELHEQTVLGHAARLYVFGREDYFDDSVAERKKSPDDEEKKGGKEARLGLSTQGKPEGLRRIAQPVSNSPSYLRAERKEKHHLRLGRKKKNRASHSALLGTSGRDMSAAESRAREKKDPRFPVHELGKTLSYQAGFVKEKSNFGRLSAPAKVKKRKLPPAQRAHLGQEARRIRASITREESRSSFAAKKRISSSTLQGQKKRAAPGGRAAVVPFRRGQKKKTT